MEQQQQNFLLLLEVLFLHRGVSKGGKGARAPGAKYRGAWISRKSEEKGRFYQKRSPIILSNIFQNFLKDFIFSYVLALKIW